MFPGQECDERLCWGSLDLPLILRRTRRSLRSLKKQCKYRDPCPQVGDLKGNKEFIIASFLEYDWMLKNLNFY